LIIVWRVNTHCNLNCGFCAHARELRTPRVTADPEAILKLAATLSAYRSETGNRVLVSWLGGEPLLWQPLISLSAALVNDFGIEVSATTNGTALGSRALRGAITRYFSELTISVDGPAAFHNEIREWPQGFEHLAAHVRSLVADRHSAGIGPRIRVNTVLMADNVKLFPRLCEELCEWGIEEISFNALGGNDRPDFHRRHQLQPQHVKWLESALPGLRRLLEPRGVRLVGGSAYLARLYASAVGERLTVSDCRAGEQFLFVTEDGVVSPCSFTTRHYGVPVAEIDSVAALRSLPIRFREMRRTASSAWCADCPSTQWFGKFAA
jgi:MoaA/NifB/PqqE/SkfB family radical SAM enzyme